MMANQNQSTEITALEQKVENLENLAAHQEHTIECLNETVSKQQQNLLSLEHKLKVLSDFLKNMKLNQESSIKLPTEEVPPPHY